MDNHLMSRLYAPIPKMNPKVCRGVVETELDKAQKYLDERWRNVSHAFPPCLKYLRCERCTPEEEYRVLSEKKGSSPSSYDLAKSDIYLLKFYFELNGEEMVPPRYMAVPYCENSITRLRGASYQISAVLADRTFSISENALFLPLLMTKMTFCQLSYSVYRNNQRTFAMVSYSKLYNLSKDDAERADSNEGPKVSTAHTLIHYLLAKYGLATTFKQFFGIDLYVGTDETINAFTHPENEWVIYKSVGVKPEGVKDKVYYPTSIVVAYNKHQETSNEHVQEIKSAIAGLYYVIDRYPVLLRENLNDTTDWQVALGRAIFNSGASHGKLLEKIEGHLISLDMYIDDFSRRDLHTDQIMVDNIYELFAYVIKNQSEMMRRVEPANIYGKQLKVLRYVLEPIVQSINKFVFDMCRSKKQEYTLKDMKALMGQYLRKDSIFAIIGSAHGEVASVSCSNDSLLTKLTTRIVTQGDTTSSSKYREIIGDSSKYLHPSLIGCSYTNQPGFDPTGQSKLNTHAYLTDDNVLMPHPDLIEENKALTRRLGGEIVYTKNGKPKLSN